MRRIYSLLLHFQDPELRPEMLDVHLRCAADERARGAFAYLRFCVAEIGGLVPPQPWIATLTLGVGLSLLAVSGQQDTGVPGAGYHSHLLRGPCAVKVPLEQPGELIEPCDGGAPW